MWSLYFLLGCGEKENEYVYVAPAPQDVSVYCQEDRFQNLIEEDQDCDDVLTADDCDDTDPSSTIVAEDGDCDGVLTADDCDDSSPESLTRAEDGDCDGILTLDDCDDADPNSTSIAEDEDCDGSPIDQDCDDTNPNSTSIPEDRDCDGIRALDDCNDLDATVGNNDDDTDCDGVLTADDCDDFSAELLAIADDGDCDGILTLDDCDDADPSTINDYDCDGVPVNLDCDDTDSLNLMVTSYQLRKTTDWGDDGIVDIEESYTYDQEERLLSYERSSAALTLEELRTHLYDENGQLYRELYLYDSPDLREEYVVNYEYDDGGCPIFEERFYEKDYAPYWYFSYSACDEAGNIAYTETDFGQDDTIEWTHSYTYTADNLLLTDESDYNLYHYTYDQYGQETLRETDYGKDGVIDARSFRFPDALGASFLELETIDGVHTTDIEQNIETIVAGQSYGTPNIYALTYNRNGQVVQLLQREGAMIVLSSEHLYDVYGRRVYSVTEDVASIETVSYSYVVTQLDCP